MRFFAARSQPIWLIRAPSTARFRSGFLTTDDYRRLGAAESLEDLRTALDDTDYGQFMQDEPSPLEARRISRM